MAYTDPAGHLSEWQRRYTPEALERRRERAKEAARVRRERLRAERDAMPMIECECGCRSMIPPITLQGRPARFRHGHNPGSESTRFVSIGDAAKIPKTGITKATYKAMLAEQLGVCAACGEPDLRRALSVDHEHRCCPDRSNACGQCTRGLLCSQCNLVLGMVGDDPDRLVALARYLRRWD